MYGYSFKEFEQMAKEEEASRNKDKLNKYIGSNKQRTIKIKCKKRGNK